jgi:hypothetical protein
MHFEVISTGFSNIFRTNVTLVYGATRPGLIGFMSLTKENNTDSIVNNVWTPVRRLRRPAAFTVDSISADDGIGFHHNA